MHAAPGALARFAARHARLAAASGCSFAPHVSQPVKPAFGTWFGPTATAHRTHSLPSMLTSGNSHERHVYPLRGSVPAAHARQCLSTSPRTVPAGHAVHLPSIVGSTL